MIEERDAKIDDLISDNKALTLKLREFELQTNEQIETINYLKGQNEDYLDQIAGLKREKETEITQLLQEFRIEREAVQQKAKQDTYKADEEARVAKRVHMHEMEQVQEKASIRRL